MPNIMQTMFNAVLDAMRKIGDVLFDFMRINRDFASNLATKTETSAYASSEMEFVILTHASMSTSFEADTRPALCMSSCTYAADINTAICGYPATSKATDFSIQTISADMQRSIA